MNTTGNIWRAVALCALSAAGICAVAWPGRIDPSRRRVVIYDDGFTEREQRLNFQKFGAINCGMFSSLEDYFKALSYSVTWSKRLDESVLKTADMVWVINPTRALDDREQPALTEWVRGGGGLLVLGDHTDILGTHTPLNRMLEPYGIQYQFDTAESFRPHFAGCLKILEDRLGRGVLDNSDIQYGRGASLRVSGPARALIVGRQTYGDPGNRNNSQGAFLGNSPYVRGDHAWDTVLVAGGAFGAGNVLAFGDTSMFQNGAITGSAAHFFPNCLAFLLPEKPMPMYSAWIALALAAIAAFAGALPPRLAALALCCGILLGECSNTLQPPRIDFDPTSNQRIAIIDASHMQRINQTPNDPHTASGLIYNVLRNGYLPVYMRNWDPRWMASAQLLITIAPQEPYSADERSQINALAERGGIVIAAASFDDSVINAYITEAVKLEIKPVPLGPVPVVRDADTRGSDVQFANAAPIGYPQSGGPVEKPEIVYQCQNLATIARCKKGKGRVIVVADDLWMLGSHMEGAFDYHEGNIRYFSRLLQDAQP